MMNAMPNGPRVPPPLLVLRADADGHIGSGHVMRCLALAQEWRRHDGEVIVLGRVNSEQLRQRLVAEGCRHVSLPAVHPQPEDLQTLVSWLNEKAGQPGWLVLDGYHFDAGYQQAIRATGWMLLVVDDYAHLPVYHADILLNPNAHACDLTYNTDSATLRLLGTRYTPLRQEFLLPAEQSPSTAPHAPRILVTMGGADPDNVTSLAIDALMAMGRQDLEVKIVIGTLNPHRQGLLDQLASARFHVEPLDLVANMAPLMRWADITVSAAGSTCWEMAALGVPMVLTVLADNQTLVASSLADLGAAVNLGWFHDWQPKQAADVITSVLANRDLRLAMKANGQKLVDGLGSERIIAQMLTGRAKLTLRPVRDSDCRLLWQWVNEPAVRSASFQSAPITWPEHQQWFLAKRNDSNSLQLIAEDGAGTPIGQVRFDTVDQEAEIDASIEPRWRGSGLGGIMLIQALHALYRHTPIRAVHAHIKSDNERSIRIFGKAGFRKVAEEVIQGQQAVHCIWRPATEQGPPRKTQGDA